MEPLLETFCLENKQLFHLKYHQDRVRWSTGQEIDISLFTKAIKSDPSYTLAQKGKWRVSVTYSPSSILSIRFVPYQVPEIGLLKPITIKENFYSYKWADRSQFESIKKELPRGTEPLFILDGLVTDTSFTNVVLEKDGQLFTPKSYLLKGTKRCCLLDKGIIHECDITLEDLRHYDTIHLVNAMLSPHQLTLPIEAVL